MRQINCLSHLLEFIETGRDFLNSLQKNFDFSEIVLSSSILDIESLLSLLFTYESKNITY